MAYPDTLDNFAPHTDGPWSRDPRRPRERAVLAVETMQAEIGTNPSDNFVTLALRLNAAPVIRHSMRHPAPTNWPRSWRRNRCDHLRRPLLIRRTRRAGLEETDSSSVERRAADPAGHPGHLHRPLGGRARNRGDGRRRRRDRGGGAVAQSNAAGRNGVYGMITLLTSGGTGSGNVHVRNIRVLGGESAAVFTAKLDTFSLHNLSIRICGPTESTCRAGPARGPSPGSPKNLGDALALVGSPAESGGSVTWPQMTDIVIGDCVVTDFSSSVGSVSPSSAPGESQCPT